MLFKILKLLGLDVPAQVEQAKAALEQRVEQATDRIKEVAQKAATIAILSALALAAAGMAAGVGLVAVYLWTADNYGDYAGLGVVGGILVTAAAILAVVAAVKARSMAPERTVDAPIALPPPVESASAGGLGRTPEPRARDYAWMPPDASTASANDLVEPLAFALSRVVKFPTIGNPTLDEIVGRLRTTAQGSAEEAIDRAADVIRHGSRFNLIFVLAGTTLLSWLVTHNSGRQP
jgi:Putative Actinobacterial Holin-X, holin superfamily III